MQVARTGSSIKVADEKQIAEVYYELEPPIVHAALAQASPITGESMRNAFIAASLLSMLIASARAEDQPTARGRYLAQIMDCAGCHTEGALIGQPKPELAL